ncbi:hypothetical protein [Luteolibacter sp. Populi]|uniref:hypothetical protein n=1 Tax=Luteolibacter sp. Populi TaxID=3230487 RepID=UPI0034677556
MTALTQPPPNLPTPPPDREALRFRRKAARIWWLGGISIGFCLLVIGVPLVLRQRSNADMSEAMGNMRSVGMMLLEFDNEYGEFPNATTAADVKKATATTLTLGTWSSNQLFRQLLAGGGGKSEKPFWAKTAISPRKPDDIFNTDATALAPGECGFAYIVGQNTFDLETPLLVAPLLPGKLAFDPKPFKGMAVVLQIDNSVRSYPIDKHGRVILNGLNLFDPRQPFWKGKTPDIKWPE